MATKQLRKKITKNSKQTKIQQISRKKNKINEDEQNIVFVQKVLQTSKYTPNIENVYKWRK
jgi:hypothetical protein